MPPKLSSIVNTLAALSSTALIALAIATFALAGEADHVFTSKFPPGSYVWSNSKWEGDCRGYCKGWRVNIEYTRSNEIKTFVAAGLALFVGLQGLFGLGLGSSPNASQVSARFFWRVVLSCVDFVGFSDTAPAVSESALKAGLPPRAAEQRRRHHFCYLDRGLGVPAAQDLLRARLHHRGEAFHLLGRERGVHCDALHGDRDGRVGARAFSGKGLFGLETCEVFGVSDCGGFGAVGGVVCG
jgi:hypothetical protein